MSKQEKFIVTLLSGGSDHNLNFDDLTKLLVSLDFQCRVKGSHHIFFKQGVEEILNLQAKGKLAKGYQVKQVRDVLVRYQLIPGELNQ
jgi:predicted RNA binding protein YcfA (HicA-like mRNA interferase family)